MSKTRCTVMCDTDSAKLSSTALSARSLTVQRLCPSGTSEQAMAISLASNAPSNVTSRGGFSLGLRSSATSRPSSTKRFLRCSIVRQLTPSAAAVSATLHEEPSAPASESNKPRAWINRLAWVFPLGRRVPRVYPWVNASWSEAKAYRRSRSSEACTPLKCHGLARGYLRLVKSSSSLRSCSESVTRYLGDIVDSSNELPLI